MTDPVDPLFPEPSGPERRPDLDKEPAPVAGPGPVPSPSGSGLRRRMGGRPARWVLAGVGIVVLVGGTAAVTAAVVDHGGRAIAVRAVPVAPGGLPGQVIAGGPDGAAVAGGVVLKGGQVVAVPGAGPAGALQGLAPAPLPSLPADQAAVKAAAAVSGGKVESLATVPEQGGGSAWQAVVLGTDGVSHLVTLDGTSGTVTSNTTVG